jgi:hypothetical protein
MIPSTEIRPSLYHCLWSIAFFAIGMGLFCFFLFQSLTHLTDNLTQIVVPGSTELSLRHGLNYTVFLEEQSVVNGKIYSTTESVSGLECHVTSVQNGATIPILTSKMTSSYSVSNRSGHSVLEFRTNEDGKYLFACAYGPSSKGPETVLAVGSEFGTNFAMLAIKSIAAIFGGVVLALVNVGVVLLLRKRDKERISQLGQIRA